MGVWRWVRSACYGKEEKEAGRVLIEKGEPFPESETFLRQTAKDKLWDVGICWSGKKRTGIEKRLRYR